MRLPAEIPLMGLVGRPAPGWRTLSSRKERPPGWSDICPGGPSRLRDGARSARSLLGGGPAQLEHRPAMIDQLCSSRAARASLYPAGPDLTGPVRWRRERWDRAGAAEPQSCPTRRLMRLTCSPGSSSGILRSPSFLCREFL